MIPLLHPGYDDEPYTECFTGSIVERACRCGGKCRPGQRNCHACHAKAQAIYRARRNVRLERLRRIEFAALFGTESARIKDLERRAEKDHVEQ